MTDPILVAVADAIMVNQPGVYELPRFERFGAASVHLTARWFRNQPITSGFYSVGLYYYQTAGVIVATGPIGSRDARWLISEPDCLSQIVEWVASDFVEYQTGRRKRREKLLGSKV